MAQKYKAVLTKIGAAKIAAATAGGTKINLTQMAVGDGGGTLPTPDPTQTKLIAEKHRAALNKVIVDPKHKNYLVAELVIPPEIGGFWMRELGLYDEVGALIAVSNMAESYKPLLSEGSGRAQTLRMVVIVSDMDTVNLLIDSSTVLATQEYVDDKLLEHEQSRRHPDATLKEKGFTQLSSATNSNSETLAATPKAVKEAYDLANGKYTAQDATTTQKGIVQLNSATNSTSEALAATSKAVKAAYDKALEADKKAQTADDNAGKANDNANTRLEKDKNLSDLKDKPLARKNLELGTAATSNVQKSATDGTANALMANGAWGIGTSGLVMKDSDILSPTSIGNAFFVQGGGADNHFGSYGAGVHISYGTGGGNTLRLTANLFVDASGNLSVEWLEVNRNDGAVKAKRLQKLYGPLNKPSARDVGAIPFYGQIPAGKNLNTLTEPGIWFNPANANATLALNYPSTQAGSLQILQDAGSTQIYTEYASGRQFRRGLYTGTWSPWRVIYDSYNKPSSDDVGAISRDSCHVAGFVNGNKDAPYMRHTASNAVVQLLPIGTADARYINNLQMGAEEYKDIPYPGQASIPLGACITAIVGTTKPTGGGVGFYISRVYFRRIQKYIGGSWKNIA